MNKELLKKLTPYLIALGTFILFAILYCSPIVFEDKVIRAGDTESWKGMYQELKGYNDNGEYSFWSGSMFSGMPTYQIGGGKIESNSLITPINKIVSLGFKDTLRIFILYLVGFFILFRAFKVNTWLSIIGAMAVTLSSYFMIIIGAGHNTKAVTIGLMAPVIAGFFLIFNRKEYLWGAVICMIYVIVGLTQHPQMSYYFFMLIGCLFFAELFIHIKEGRIKDLLIATVIFAASIGIGIGTQFTKTQLNREYVQETMRGGHSELAKENDTINKTTGLDLDYATQWSYGVDETMTLLIPNFKGGSSNYDVGTNSNTYKAMTQHGVPRKNAEDFSKNVPAYWGTQPFTSGPVYVGAIIFFLFILGLLIVKGPYKWALLVATIFSILLSLGKNFMPLTEFFFNWFPMYNKFRAVSSILVVAEISMPLLGFLALKDIFEKKIEPKLLLNKMWISAGITGGICLIFCLFGGFFYNFTSPSDAQNFDPKQYQWLLDAIVADRASMFRMDAFRSLAFMALAAGTLWLFITNKIKPQYALVALGLFIVTDLWVVDRRFLNDDNFVTEKLSSSYFKKQPYEEYLLQDKDPNFRVLNLTTNTFNESRTSYYFKSVGGYHAAKLRRYQDLIDRHISKFNMQVLNMLNTKYFITPGNDNNPMPQLNPNAMGNAWFVDTLLVVNTPNEEIDALDSINVITTAVLDAKFGNFVKDFIPHQDSAAQVKFLFYKPNRLEYETSASQDGVVVFSEIYYPYGWHAYIDNKPVDHFRANYVLRALPVPAGTHQIRFEFDPDILHSSEPISYICLIIVYLTLIGAIVYEIFQYRKKKKEVVVKK
ncbi:MAG: YfhO family protein [Bacteroidales bacterium]|jgi:hypothetical protein|nr:YfhO family protein [Bacteroidales bacterium]